MITRRKFLKKSLSGFALATLPVISFAQSNPDVVVIGAGAYSTVHGADRSGRRVVDFILYSSSVLKNT
tara:strand:+ start:30 stop:233 length:204 start_codon:yes stop_codon:yes gene_type:complete